MRTNAFLILSLGIAIASLPTCTASGQTAEGSPRHAHELRIVLGGSYDQVKDELIAPIRWDGPGTTFELAYLVTGEKLHQAIELQLPVSFLADRYDHKAYAFGASLRYARLSLIRRPSWGGALFLGPQVRLNANCRFYADWDDSHLYWLNAYDLGPALKWSKASASKYNLSVTVQTPLLALVSRPPAHQYFDQAHLKSFGYYLDALHSHLRLASINRYGGLSLSTEYRRQVNSKIVLGGAWMFEYEHASFPESIGIVTDTLVCHVAFVL